MALISCPECGKKVSSLAASCPECGCPINATPAPAAQQPFAADVEKLTTLARRARESEDNGNAKKYYDQILLRDPGNWEAMFFSVYYDALDCKIINIASSANALANNIGSTFAAIGDLEDRTQQERAVDLVELYALAAATIFHNAAVNHYQNNSTAQGVVGECSGRVIAVANIYLALERGYKSVFPQMAQKRIKLQRMFLDFLNGNQGWFEAKSLDAQISRLNKELLSNDSKYAKEQKIRQLRSKIESKERELCYYPTTRTIRAPVAAAILLWTFAFAFLAMGYVLLEEGAGVGLLTLGGILSVLAVIGCTKTPSRAKVASNKVKAETIKRQIAKLREELDQL